MSGDVKAAIAETAARAKKLLFNADGKMVGPDNHVASFVMQTLLIKITTIAALGAGNPVFDWRGKTYAYRKDATAVLIDGADGDPFIDRVLCKVAAIMLDARSSIPDPKLQLYVTSRLMGGLTPLAKRGRGKKITTTDYRDIVIVGRLIAPLRNRFNPTRNAETKHIESACSITKEALANVGVHMSEKRLENIWAKFSHLYVPAK